MRGNKLNIKDKKKYLTLLEKYLVNLKKLYKKKNYNLHTSIIKY